MTRRALGFMHVIGVDLDAWCKRYDLEPFNGKCPKCGTACRVDVPFAWGESRGLVANTCDCGCDQMPFEIARLFERKEPKRVRARTKATVRTLRRRE